MNGEIQEGLRGRVRRLSYPRDQELMLTIYLQHRYRGAVIPQVSTTSKWT